LRTEPSRRELKKVYEKVSEASRAHPRDPGFWKTLSDNIRTRRVGVGGKR
jgi:hypothetical protein